MLHPDTPILIPSGDLIPIADLNIGDYIMTPNGECEILNKMIYSNQPTTKIMITGLDPVICNPETEFLISRFGQGHYFDPPQKGDKLVYYKPDIMELISVDNVYQLSHTPELISLSLHYNFHYLVYGKLIIRS